MFSTCLDNFLPFSSNLKLSSANSFSLEESKICRLVMGLYTYLNLLFVNLAGQKSTLRLSWLFTQNEFYGSVIILSNTKNATK